jgi:hypothetical protein
MIKRDGRLTVKRPCELLGLNRTGVYYQPRPMPEADLRLMRRIDELTLTPTTAAAFTSPWTTARRTRCILAPIQYHWHGRPNGRRQPWTFLQSKAKFARSTMSRLV